MNICHDRTYASKDVLLREMNGKKYVEGEDRTGRISVALLRFFFYMGLLLMNFSWSIHCKVCMVLIKKYFCRK